ncbi:hypothetical protein GLOTRDRAFT_138754 [Gloeophyllum trabeum ATCC 11539]|uniref:Uncharacterized protein n=1 Tax=Gloeophyllum trabeum (strain ATCC 11539 / FP-39264 / Madison 617) TaxID=670483 RepID=S7RL06_GLOTA|nr:uncharacterized protein GLOTRDRAFT_138754 [Gloeophyllum trabeum ATCC 11539]EPQ55040.1 hypothetical protein GLOTRDRAFT_138754 [Gloeophyllum trabeum ATCC 11539]
MSSTKVLFFGEQARINPVQLGHYATKHVIDQSRGVEATVAHGLTTDQTATPTNASVTSSPITRQTPDLHERHVSMPPAVAGNTTSLCDTYAAPTQQKCIGLVQAFPPFTPNLPPRLRKARPGRRERALLRLQREADLLQETATEQQNQATVPMQSHGTVEARLGATNVVLPLPGSNATDEVSRPTPGDLAPRRKARPGRRERAALRRLQQQAGILQEPSTLQQVEAPGLRPGPDPTLSPTTTHADASSLVVEGDVVGKDGVQSSHDQQLAEPVSTLAQGQANDVQKVAASQHDHPSISPPPYDPIALGLEAERFILQQHGSRQYPTEAMAHDQPQERHLVDWAIQWQEAASGLPRDGASTATVTLPQIHSEQAEGGAPLGMANVESLPSHHWQPKPFTPSSPPMALAGLPIRNFQNDEYEAPCAFPSEWPVPTAHQAPEMVTRAPYETPMGTMLEQAGAFPAQQTGAPYAQELVQFPAALEPHSLPLSQAIYPFVDCPGPCPPNCPTRLRLARAHPRHQGRPLSRLPYPTRFDPFSDDLDSEWEARYYPAADAGEPNSPTSPISPATATSASAPTPRTAGLNAGHSPCSSCERLARAGEEILYTTCCGYKSATVPAGDDETDGVTMAIPVRRERKRGGLVGSTPSWYLDQRQAHRYLALLRCLEYHAILRAKAKEANPEDSDRPPLTPLWTHFPELLEPISEVPPQNMLHLHLSGN